MMDKMDNPDSSEKGLIKPKLRYFRTVAQSSNITQEDEIS